MHGTPARARTRRQVPHENPRTQGSSAHFGADSSQNFFSCARTKASSAHRTPKPPTWSTTSGVWMQKPRRAPPRGRAVSQNSHRTQGCGRPPGPSRCSPRRTQPRGRPPRPLRCTVRRTLPRGRPPAVFGCRNRVEHHHVGEQPARIRIEPKDVVDHQGPLDAARAEPSHVVDHQGHFGAGSAPNPWTWASSRPEPTSNPGTWSTTYRLSMQPTPSLARKLLLPQKIRGPDERGSSGLKWEG
jgi:hypothetical protein